MSEQNNTPAQVVEPTPGSPEYDAAMIAKFDAHQAGSTSSSSTTEGQPVVNEGKSTDSQDGRPSGLPENFKSVEELNNSYKALQAELTKLKQGTSNESNKGNPSGSKNDEAPKSEEMGKDTKEGLVQETDEQKAAREATEAAGVDYNKLSEEFAEKGELSAESYEKLAKAGISKDMVNTYIAGQQAMAEARDNALYQVVDGKEKFEAMAVWAKSGGMTPQEIEAFDRVVSSGTNEAAMLALKGLKASYEAAKGSSPKLFNGSNQQSSELGGFRSQAEMVSAMRDPRYQKDAAYRADVEARVATTTAF